MNKQELYNDLKEKFINELLQFNFGPGLNLFTEWICEQLARIENKIDESKS